MIKEVLWDINIESYSDDFGLSQDEINYILHIFNDTEYREEYNDLKTKVKNTFPDDKLANWQCDKGVEIDKLFEDNLKYKISDNKVFITCQYNVMLGESFDKGDVSIWATTLHHLSQILPRIEILKIKNSYSQQITYDKEPYHIYKKFLESLTNNQKVEINRL